MSKGKKDKLIQARKAVMNNIRKQLEPESEDEDIDLIEEIDSEEEDWIQIQNFNQIKKNFVNYVSDYNLPLCEYLTTEDIKNFIDEIYEPNFKINQ